MKVRAEIKELEKKKQQQRKPTKNQWNEEWFFDMINNIDLWV